jgi:putative two-component system response regulator
VYELADSIRERDQVTYEHCRRVAIYVNRLARHMGWSRRAARDLALAGLVHDLGKTWMHNSVLHKESALSHDERHEMERHPAIAARILEAYGVSYHIIDVVRHHHETYNGTGYPDHLSAEDIPVGARLLTVADVFDVLTTERPYKPALNVVTARARIAAGAGTQFDPQVVQAIVELLESAPGFVLQDRTSPRAQYHVHKVTEAGHDSALRQITLLMEYLERFSDSRSGQRITYPMAGVLALVILSLLSGPKSLSAVSRWGATHPDALDALRLPRSPSASTLSRLLQGVSVVQMRAALWAFVQAVQRTMGDRKSTYGSSSRQEWETQLHKLARRASQELDRTATSQPTVDRSSAAITRAWMLKTSQKFPGLLALTLDDLIPDQPLHAALVLANMTV